MVRTLRVYCRRVMRVVDGSIFNVSLTSATTSLRSSRAPGKKKSSSATSPSTVERVGIALFVNECPSRGCSFRERFPLVVDGVYPRALSRVSSRPARFEACAGELSLGQAVRVGTHSVR